METCKNHKNIVVVYDGWEYRDGCPFCLANAKIEEVKKELEQTHEDLTKAEEAIEDAELGKSVHVKK